MLIRYREQKRLFRKSILVLQIGIKHKRGSYIGPDSDMVAPPEWDEEEIVVTWRDATMEDLTEQHKLGE